MRQTGGPHRPVGEEHQHHWDEDQGRQVRPDRIPEVDNLGEEPHPHMVRARAYQAFADQEGSADEGASCQAGDSP